MTQIERALASERWQQARALIRRALRSEPEDHWLITALGLTYYEQRQYRRALAYSERALALAPRCPLVLWDYAGCLHMLNREQEALRIYRRLTRLGVRRMAFGECGEGLRWAKSMVVDCHYRMACCHQRLGHLSDAKHAFRLHLALRAQGYRSIYPLRDVRQEIRDLEP